MNSPYPYGHGLYFPYINFKDINWLKQSALYFDRIVRIVPSRLNEAFVDRQRAVIDEFNAGGEPFVENLAPNWDQVYRAGKRLIDLLPMLKTKQDRKGYFERIRGTLPSGRVMPIHLEKVGSEVQERLLEYGLGYPGQFSRDRDWVIFDSAIGAIYMSILASEIAQDYRLPLLSDDLCYPPLIGEIQYPKNGEDYGYRLASLVIESVVPVDIAELSPKAIMQFKRDYADERKGFYEKVNELVKDIGEVLEPTALDSILKDRQEKIMREVKNLERALYNKNISTGQALMTISVPSYFQGPSGQLIGLGLFFMGAFTLVKGKGEAATIRGNSPYTYVLNLRDKLSGDNFLRELTRGQLLT